MRIPSYVSEYKIDTGWFLLYFPDQGYDSARYRQDHSE